MKSCGKRYLGAPACAGLLFAATALWYISFAVVFRAPASDVPTTFWFLTHIIGPLICIVLGLEFRESYSRRQGHRTVLLWTVLAIGWSPFICILVFEGWPMIRWRLLH